VTIIVITRGRLGSLDDGDPQTTNLYVVNLSSKVDENFLLRTFGRFGPIASVKIMWPRTEEEKRRERHCGFVAFMNRADGEAAKEKMQGIIVYEYELKIGWGKVVFLPSQALPAPPPGHMAIRSKEGCNLIFSVTSGPPMNSVPNQNSELVLTPNVPDITVISPEDEHLKQIIDTMALNVLDGGCAFEQAIMERGRGNPLFNFLFELGSKEHTYYVWRLYSFAQGDTLQRWRTEPYIMIAGSGRWIPPPLPATRSPEHGKESRGTYAAGKSRCTEAEQTLTDSQRDEFEDMLRALTLERSQIREAMGFALDNAEAAGEVVEVLTESLTLKETSIPTKVARLMLVSDIIHNSSARVKNASAYRTKFEATLPDIMESFNDLYHSVHGRITAEALRVIPESKYSSYVVLYPLKFCSHSYFVQERVLKVLQVWADWFLFSDAYINGLRATFLRSRNFGVTSFHSICGDAPDIEKKGLIGNMNDADKINQDAALAMGEGAARQELMNRPISELERRCRHNGLSLLGGREMMVARLVCLKDAEKQRGYEVVDENAKYRQGHSTWEEVNIEPKRMKTSYDKVETEEPVDLASTIPIPQPELKAFVKKEKIDLILPTSRWAREDDETDDEQKKSYSSGSDNAGGITFKTDEEDLKADPSVRVQPENEIDVEQRQKLRHIEIALIEYRESLEEQGMKNSEEIERKVAIHRKRLEADGLSGNQRVLPEKREKREDSRDSSRKRNRSESQNRSQSPPQKSLTRERVRDHDLDKDRHRDRDRQQHDLDKDRKRRAKSSSRERDDHDRSRERDRDWRRRGMR
jgi:U2-associated protein SR140